MQSPSQLKKELVGTNATLRAPRVAIQVGAVKASNLSKDLRFSVR